MIRWDHWLSEAALAGRTSLCFKSSPPGTLTTGIPP
jgi:hypothetical protein